MDWHELRHHRLSGVGLRLGRRGYGLVLGANDLTQEQVVVGIALGEPAHATSDDEWVGVPGHADGGKAERE